MSKFSHLNMVDQTQNAKSRTFSLKTAKLCRHSPSFIFLRIENFFAFFDYLSAIVFSKVTDVSLPQRSSQNGCQPAVSVFFAHQALLVQLVKITMGLVAQGPEFPVGHRSHRGLRPGMHTNIGVAGRISAANIKHRVLIVVTVNTVSTSQNRMAATVRASGCQALSSFLFHNWSLQNKKAGRPHNYNLQRERLPLADIVAEQPSGIYRNKPMTCWIAHR